MTRKEFIEAYAERSGLSARWSSLGVLDVDAHTLFALPCGCGGDKCKGWALVGIEAIDHHLMFNAPTELRAAYLREIERKDRVSKADVA